MLLKCFGHFTEYMRMPADQLFGDRLHYVAEIERALLLGHASVIDDLEQEVAQFLLEVGKIVARYGIGDFIGFFQCVWRDGRKILRQIPWTSCFRCAQRRHDFEETADVAGRSHDNRSCLMCRKTS